REPRSAPLLAALGRAAARAGQPTRAAPHLAGALARGERDPLVLDAQGRVLQAQGDLNGALELFRAATTAAPEIAALAQVYAAALIEARRFEEALAVLAPTLERDPFDQASLAYKVLALQCAGDPSADGLVDLERFVGVEEIEAPAGFGSPE